ncbi:MAG TPA: ribosome recycling factor [Saprospiraceae bacterium]|nr:ribosome recycling factor [Saprospiraceae bacterium]
MAEDMQRQMQQGKEIMDKALEHLHKELNNIRTGKASPAMLSSIKVEYYGNPTPLNQVSSVSTSDAKTLTIQPWEKSLLPVIEQAIFAANIGLTPMNDGDLIRINVPALTEERRRDLVKQAKHLGEEAKVSLRTARHKLLDVLKKEVKNGFPEDAGKRLEAEIDKLMHNFSDQVDKSIGAKEKDIMTV